MAANTAVVGEHFASEIRGRLDAAPGPVAALAVADALRGLLANGRFDLPPGAVACRPDRYARRLLHRDAAQRFAIVVMAWGPGQISMLHDHDGSWCVEGVVAGRVFSEARRLLDERDGVCRFGPSTRIDASAGQAAALVPPFDHHVFGNASATESAVTVHVYGPEFSQCRVFEPRSDGAFELRVRPLAYDPW